MTDTSKKPRVYFISNYDLKRAEEKLDLDESVEASLYLYPHKDKLFRLTKIVDFDSYQSLLEQCEKLEKALEFYGDEDKYFMKEVTIKPKDCVFASKYNEEKGQCESVEIKEPFTSKIYECSARLKVDQGKQARQALAEFKKFKGEL